MAPFSAWNPRQLNLSRTLVIAAVALALYSPSRQAAAEPVAGAIHSEMFNIQLDQAKIIKMPDRTATLVVGNPLIADVSVQNGRVLVITGKSYGVTNLVALDRSGQTLMEGTIDVRGPSGNIVTVYHGVERETYSCTPTCERRITLGDTANYFTTTLTQSGTLSTQAQGTPAK